MTERARAVGLTKAQRRVLEAMAGGASFRGAADRLRAQGVDGRGLGFNVWHALWREGWIDEGITTWLASTITTAGRRALTTPRRKR